MEQLIQTVNSLVLISVITSSLLAVIALWLTYRLMREMTLRQAAEEKLEKTKFNFATLANEIVNTEMIVIGSRASRVQGDSFGQEVENQSPEFIRSLRYSLSEIRLLFSQNLSKGESWGSKD